MQPISRRTFLALTGGLAVAAACGGSNGGSGQATADFVPLRVSSDLFASTDAQRFAFALTKNDRFFDGADASIAFVSPSNDSGERMDAVLRSEGLPDGRGIYVVDAPLASGGVWFGEIEVEGQSVELPFEVGSLPTTLVPGEPAWPAPSPTLTDPLGVDPICTREPACDLHDRSLHELIGAGRPVAVAFSTPARCGTQYCGPTLDLLLDVKDDFTDSVDFVHVEIYQNLTSSNLVPTVETWTLQSEPWLFGIDAGGRVTERLDGAFDLGEVRGLVERLSVSEPQSAPEIPEL